jgi:hypothetical protein
MTDAARAAVVCAAKVVAETRQLRDQGNLAVDEMLDAAVRSRARLRKLWR